MQTELESSMNCENRGEKISYDRKWKHKGKGIANLKEEIIKYTNYHLNQGSANYIHWTKSAYVFSYSPQAKIFSVIF
jgi:hypothetical protein